MGVCGLWLTCNHLRSYVSRYKSGECRLDVSEFLRVAKVMKISLVRASVAMSDNVVQGALVVAVNKEDSHEAG